MANQENHTWIKHWLGQKAFPRWSVDGVDSSNGSFFESLSRDLKPVGGARRAMVQGRQIYSFAEGARMGLLEAARAKKIVTDAASFLIKNYAQTNGSLVHSVDASGSFDKAQADLYAQAFAIFGLANAYQLEKREEFKTAALENVKYLRRERAHKKGGFSETLDGKVHYQQNPHMHLFEAALAWGKVDKDPEWKKLTSEILSLFRESLVDRQTGFLGENFTENWEPERIAGRFYFEPGHQYEWSWLLAQAKEVFGLESGDLSLKLFNLSEKHGLDKKTGLVYDEVWSDGQVKKSSSRFWPQSERIKAALVCGQGAVADQALHALKKFLPEAPGGVWEDSWLGEGFNSIPYKSSSFYHIINALSEYVRLRDSI